MINHQLDGMPVADNQIVIHLKTPITSEETRKYTLMVGPGVFISETTGMTSPFINYSWTVEPKPVVVETFDYGFSYASFGVNDNYDYQYKYAGNDFDSNVTFTGLPTGVTLDSSKAPAKWIREDGATVEADITYFLNSAWMMFTMSAPWPIDPYGVWTCVLPQGLFKDGEKESVEKTLKITWIDPNATNDRPEFEVTKVDFFNTPDIFRAMEGAPANVPVTMMYTLWKTVTGGENLMDWESSPKAIASLNQNRGIVFNTTWDEWIECFVAEVQRKDGTGDKDVWNQETVQEATNGSVYCKNYVGTSGSDCVAYPHPLLGCGGNANTREYEQGVVYTFDIYFYDSMQKRGMDWQPGHKLACGSYHFEFTGATVPYEYSTIAKLVSISPVPANITDLGLAPEDPGVVKGVNDKIVFTWSAPVTMTATYSLGQGAGLGNLQSCTPNADRTVWTVVPGAAVVSDGEGGTLSTLEFNVQAVDADGHYVKGNVGAKDYTMFVPQFKFEDVETGLEGVEAMNLVIEGADGMLSVSGLSEGSQISLYTLTGVEVANRVVAGTSATIGNVLNGTYLLVIKSGDVKKTVKILL